MSFENLFSSEAAKQYLADIKQLINEINQINQQIFQSSQQYIQEGYSEYSAHLQSLFTLKNPMEMFEANRKYLEHSTAKFQELVTRRYSLFQELVATLNKAQANGFKVPSSVQDLLSQFKRNSNIDAFKPENWSKFSEFFKSQA